LLFISREEAMKLLGIVIVALTLVSCREHFIVDTTPPTPPQGVIATALSNSVEVRWLRNQEPDVAGYRVWISDRYDGEYKLIGTTVEARFVDLGARNGERVYYGISAYDFEDNESELSTDVVYATPRPEGFGTKLNNYRVAPLFAGYDFSTYSIGNYNDDYTDVFFEALNGRYYLNVWDDTDIQDMGYTGSLYDIVVAPEGGWAPSRIVEAIPGHTYIVWTWDDHFAKIRVREVTPQRITFDWAYQIAKSNPDLKRTIPAGGTRQVKPNLLSALRK
jgi:hypothetical protein